MFNASLLNSVLYTLGWFWCVWWGANNLSWIAFFGAFALIVTQLINIAFIDKYAFRKDMCLSVGALALGFIQELAFLKSGVIVYSNANFNFPPLWILVLYPLFALLLNHSLQFLQKSYWLAFLVGLLGAPLSYIAGEYMGAVILKYSLSMTWVVIGISWGIFLVVLIAFYKWTEVLFEKK